MKKRENVLRRSTDKPSKQLFDFIPPPSASIPCVDKQALCVAEHLIRGEARSEAKELEDVSGGEWQGQPGSLGTEPFKNVQVHSVNGVSVG